MSLLKDLEKFEVNPLMNAEPARDAAEFRSRLRSRFLQLSMYCKKHESEKARGIGYIKYLHEKEAAELLVVKATLEREGLCLSRLPQS